MTPTLKPGQRVVLREGATYRLMSGNWPVIGAAREGGKSATVVRFYPHAVRDNVEGVDTHGETVWFTAQDAEIAGPLP